MIYFGKGDLRRLRSFRTWFDLFAPGSGTPKPIFFAWIQFQLKVYTKVFESRNEVFFPPKIVHNNAQVKQIHLAMPAGF